MDGAMGSYLREFGVDKDDCVAELNLTEPETISQVHSFYKLAGAEALTTNTFQANRLALSRYGLENQLEEINRAGLALAREQKPFHILASVGPVGLVSYPFIDPNILEGSLKRIVEEELQEAYDMFKEQIEILASEQPDAILLETFTSLGEARMAVKAAKDTSDIPVMLSFVFNEDGRLLKTDESIDEVVGAFSSLGADAYGLNCMDPELSLKLVPKFTKQKDYPIFVRPSAGNPLSLEGVDRYPVSPDEFARYAQKFYEAQVQMIGGCCGTNPAHIGGVYGQIAQKSIK